MDKMKKMLIETSRELNEIAVQLMENIDLLNQKWIQGRQLK